VIVRFKSGDRWSVIDRNLENTAAGRTVSLYRLQLWGGVFGGTGTDDGNCLKALANFGRNAEAGISDGEGFAV